MGTLTLFALGVFAGAFGGVVGINMKISGRGLYK
jgi:hypothetical protein